MASPLLPDRSANRPIDFIAAFIPLGLIVGFFLIYLASPTAYLTYIISFKDREKQAVELITWSSALVAALILFTCAARQWLISSKAPGGSLLPGGAVFIFLVGLASFFFFGEEISWGQTWFKWTTPTEMQKVSRETNLHNGYLGHAVRLAGNLFVVGMFIVLPIVWKLRHKLPIKLPADWKPGIAEWPAGVCVILGFLIALPKTLYMATHTKEQCEASTFYMQYLEELFEQKEMLFAVAMLIFALYRIAAIRRQAAVPTITSGDDPQ
jgi:hypothetical protein